MTKNQLPQRPILEISPSPLEVGLEIAAVIGVLVGLFFVGQSWAVLPDRIPIHFGISGQPDNWGPKSMIWLLPGTTIILEVVLTLVSRYPHTFNYPVKITPENARYQYQIARSLMIWLKLEIVWFFAWIVRQQIQVAIGAATGLGAEFLGITLVFILGTTGFYFWQAYQGR